MLTRDIDKKSVHNRVASAILGSGKPQSWIAHRLGIGRSTVAAWTNPYKDTIPDYETMCRLADVLKVDVSFLYNVTDIERIDSNDDGEVHTAAVMATDTVRDINLRYLFRVPDSVRRTTELFKGLSYKRRLMWQQGNKSTNNQHYSHEH